MIRIRLKSPAPLRCSPPASTFRIPHSAFRIGAFTLIELLVVISILVILGALAFPALRGALDGAKRTQAKNDSVQIVTAINAFYTEYGQYPCGSQAGDDASDYGAADDATHSRLMDDLRASTGPTALNPRGIQFLSVPTAKDPNAEAGGPRSGIGGNGRFYDPWGSCYRIKMDNNYNGRLPNPYSANAGFPVINAGAIAYSFGRDKTGGSGDKNSGAGKDDVLSWY